MINIVLIWFKVDKLILLWYKALEDMPTPEQLVSDKTLTQKLLVKHMREDNLMIRFIVFPEVKTKGKYNVYISMLGC